jgi:hypothetical protein
MNTTQIKNVNIKFNNGVWNPKTHHILLKYNPNSELGFGVIVVPVDYEAPIEDLSMANEILKKFKI